MDLSFLPAVNATLNALSAVLLMVGLVLIKRKRVEAHRNCMIGAFAVSALFLVSYVTHYVWRASVMGTAHTTYQGDRIARTFYYSILISHIMLAPVVPILAIWLIRLGLGGRFDRHRRVARIGFPMWMYVSVTGVIIFLMLYGFRPIGP